MTRDPKPSVLAFLTHRYSGSTLLAYVLATHPDVTTLGEGQRFYWKACRTDRKDAPDGALTCSCGEPFATCAYWQGIRTKLDATLPPAALARDFTRFRFFYREWPNRIARSLATSFVLRGRSHRLPPPLGSRYRMLAEANANLARAVMEEGGGRVYLDTSKDAASTVLFARSPAVAGRMVHLVRDGRGQIHSTLSRRPELGLEAICHRWVEKTRQHLSILERLDGDFRRVRYEDFCADPMAVSRALLTDVGLDGSGLSLDFRAETRHVMGNRGLRLGSAREIRDPQKWKDDFGPSDLATIERIAGPLLRETGYE